MSSRRPNEFFTIADPSIAARAFDIPRKSPITTSWLDINLFHDYNVNDAEEPDFLQDQLGLLGNTPLYDLRASICMF